MTREPTAISPKPGGRAVVGDDAASRPQWYRDGLCFTCTQCGNCCTGAPGYVWVNKKEIEQLAAVMGMGVEHFEARYVRKVGIRRSLKELPNYDCVLFDPESRKCRAYDARPRQCRTWPFWDSNLSSRDAWKQTCHMCPGSGRGKLHKLAYIESQRQTIHV